MSEIPEITEIAVRPRCGFRSKGTRTKRDELQTFVGSKKNKLGNRSSSQPLSPRYLVLDRGAIALIKLLSVSGRLLSVGIVFGM